MSSPYDGDDDGSCVPKPRSVKQSKSAILLTWHCYAFKMRIGRQIEHVCCHLEKTKQGRDKLFFCNMIATASKPYFKILEQE